MARAIRLATMRARELPFAELARESGIGETRLRKLIENDPIGRPRWKLHEALSVWDVLRANAATATLADIGLSACDDDAAELAMGHAVAEMCVAGAELAQVAADGRVDPGEQATVDRATGRLQAVLTMFRAAVRR